MIRPRSTFVAVLFCALLFGVSSFAQSVNGVFRVVKGEVEVKSAKTGQISKARIGAKVFPQDTIITKKDSRAKVVMSDNNEINISPESQITLEKYEYMPEQGKKDVLINVMYGKVRSKVEQKYEGANRFQVKTASAVAGVRGTDFLASYNPQNGSSQVVTFKGLVEVGQPGANGAILDSVKVPAGNFTVKLPGQPPAPPAAMPKSDLNNLDSNSDAEKSNEADSPEAKSDSPAKEEGKKEEKKEEPKKDDMKKEEPKKDESRKDEPKKDERDGNSSEKRSGPASGNAAGPAKPGAPAGGAATSNGTSPDSRTPSSVDPSGTTTPPPTSGTSMISSGDMAPPPTMLAPPPTIMMPPPIISPVISPTLTNNDYINSVIQETNAKITIRVIQGQ